LQDEAWIPLIYEISSPAGKAQMAGPVIANVDDTDFEILYRLPIPTLKANLRLHIDGMRIGVHTASPGNHVVKFNVSGVSYQNVDVLAQCLEPVTMKMMKTHMFSAQDVSKWESLTIRVWCSVSAPVKLGLTTAFLHCYYV
jgi:hypothetical protein